MIEIFNEIKHNTFYIDKSDQSFDDIKSYLSLNSPNLEIVFQNINLGSFYNEKFKLTFLNWPILIFDRDSNQKLHLICQSVELKIHRKGFKEIISLNTNIDNNNSSDYLFVPLAQFGHLWLFNFKKITDTYELDEWYEHFWNSRSNKNSGFIIPIKKLDHMYYDKEIILTHLRANQRTTKDIFKARRVDLPIYLLDDILEIKELSSGDVSHINFSFENKDETTIFRNTKTWIMNDLSSINPKFSKIHVDHTLSAEEFSLIWEILSSRRTRFCLSYISLELNNLWECLVVLSLCIDCPELQYISLSYLKSDFENTEHAIANTVTNFRKKFGFIEYINLIES